MAGHPALRRLRIKSVFIRVIRGQNLHPMNPIAKFIERLPNSSSRYPHPLVWCAVARAKTFLLWVQTGHKPWPALKFAVHLYPYKGCKRVFQDKPSKPQR